MFTCVKILKNNIVYKRLPLVLSVRGLNWLTELSVFDYERVLVSKHNEKFI